jgi:hypothetical protein
MKVRVKRLQSTFNLRWSLKILKIIEMACIIGCRVRGDVAIRRDWAYIIDLIGFKSTICLTSNTQYCWQILRYICVVPWGNKICYILSLWTIGYDWHSRLLIQSGYILIFGLLLAVSFELNDDLLKTKPILPILSIPFSHKLYHSFQLLTIFLTKISKTFDKNRLVDSRAVLNIALILLFKKSGLK